MIVVPALTPSVSGGVDNEALRPYAKRARDTWVDAFLLSGSTTRGDLLSVGEKARIIDSWLECLPADRLIACCWNEADLREARHRGVRAMAVLRQLTDESAALDFLGSLPIGAYIYSHPMYTPTVFDARMATLASNLGVLPAGGKVAKINLRQIEEMRRAAGGEFVLLDGSSRHISESIRAGAAGVIATPLCHLPKDFPVNSLPGLQAAIDKTQDALDALPDRAARTAFLMSEAFSVAL
jgi:dihydrodipicolinate synthase/N-acetylneuraminate lyase